MNYLKIAFGVLVVLSASRFIPHPPNFTSLLALSFYIPAVFGKKYIPVVVMALLFTDLFLGFHSTSLENGSIPVMMFDWSLIQLNNIKTFVFLKMQEFQSLLLRSHPDQKVFLSVCRPNSRHYEHHFRLKKV